MKNNIYNIVDWDHYKEYLTKEIDLYADFTLKYLLKKNQKYKILDQRFIKSYFFFSISNIIFMNYLKLNHNIENKKKQLLTNIFFFKTKKKISIKIFDIKNIDFSNKIINMGFFHRHYIFEKNFSNNVKNFINYNLFESSKYFELEINEKQMKNYFHFQISDDFLEDLLTLEKNFDFFNDMKYPNYLMTSSHGYAKKSINKLFISFSKLMGTKIISLQGNFLQGIVKFYDFNIYEELISDFYFSTGKNLNIKNYLILGSLYSYRLNQTSKMDNKKNCIILDQPIPANRINPLQISLEWSRTFKEFQSEEKNLFLEIKKIVKNDNNIILQTKDISYIYYEEKLKKYGISSGNLFKMNVNENNYDYPIYENVYFTYLSNAIVEYFYMNCSLFFNFNKYSYYLKEIDGKIVDINDDISLKNFVTNFASKVKPEEATKTIIDNIKCS